MRTLWLIFAEKSPRTHQTLANQVANKGSAVDDRFL
jgi:hypothetical protein